MNDQSADKYVETFLPAIKDAASEEQHKRVLRLMVKEVERDARHKIIDLLNKVTQDVHNLQYE